MTITLPRALPKVSDSAGAFAPGLGLTHTRLRMMKAALSWIVAFAIVPACALAQDKPSIEITLDIDKDGKMDRATSVGQDLHIYLAGDTQPAFSKTIFTTQRILELSKGKGTLLVKYGCGGCSNDYETTLTIMHRDGEFLVAAFTYVWDTRNDGVGGCTIDLLKGKGDKWRGTGKKPIKAKFPPVKLTDWSDDKRPKACDF
jgi:hypothetical protein